MHIQSNGNTTFAGNLTVGGAAAFSGNVGIGGKIAISGAQQIVFSNDNTTNNLKLQLWNGYGLGINHSTLFYAANGNHAWRDSSGNERMLLTTANNGGLTVKGTGTSSFAGPLNVAGRILRHGQALSSTGDANHGAKIVPPWGTTDDWSIFVAP